MHVDRNNKKDRLRYSDDAWLVFRAKKTFPTSLLHPRQPELFKQKTSAWIYTVDVKL